MNRIACILLIGTFVVTQSGCLVGTMATRTNRVVPDDKPMMEVSPFGAVPYAATGSDFAGLQDFNDEDDIGAMAAMLSFVSIPLDFVVDTICLPADLILWPFGLRKNNTPYVHH